MRDIALTGLEPRVGVSKREDPRTLGRRKDIDPCSWPDIGRVQITSRHEPEDRDVSRRGCPRSVHKEWNNLARTGNNIRADVVRRVSAFRRRPSLKPLEVILHDMPGRDCERRTDYTRCARRVARAITECDQRDRNLRDRAVE